MHELVSFAYLVAGILFILALRGLSHPETARNGNRMGMAGMALAIATTLTLPQVQDYWWIAGGIALGGAIGFLIAKQIKMTALPQLVAAFHSLVGLAAVLVAVSAFLAPNEFGITLTVGSLVEISLGAAIGMVTFAGSTIAFAKLQGLIGGKPLRFANQHRINAGLGLLALALVVLAATTQSAAALWLLLAITCALGFLLILPIGGADMPVVVSLLNSYSGWAAAATGFTLHNNLLIITGALVGASGAILSHIMCRGMNRSLWNVIFGGYSANAVSSGAESSQDDRPVHPGSAEDAAYIMREAQDIIIVPGYGMAVAQAQHALREMADRLKANGARVRYAIHPVAGRMPGHMNVLLAEANVPYDEVFELDEINRDFVQADIAFVIGANDVTNPAAKTDPTSPIYGMPVLDVEMARQVLFVKRSMAAGYAGVENELFYNDNTLMLFGDAKKMCEQIVKAME